MPARVPRDPVLSVCMVVRPECASNVSSQSESDRRTGRREIVMLGATVASVVIALVAWLFPACSRRSPASAHARIRSCLHARWRGATGRAACPAMSALAAAKFGGQYDQPMTIGGVAGTAPHWPEIVYKQVGHKLVACTAEGAGYREVYPTPARRYGIPKEFPNEALQRINALSPRTRRKLERLAAYCPSQCPVLIVYVVDNWLLLKLSGDVLMRDGGMGGVLMDAEKPGRAAFRPHQPQWLISPPDTGTWSVQCRHGLYLVDAFEAFTVACAAYVSRKRRTIAATALMPALPDRSQM